MEVKRARRVVLERAAHARREQAPTPEPTATGGIRIEHGDFRSLDVAGADVIITDPPYLKECADLWRDLGKLAATALKPGGLLIAYSGHTTFPEAFDGLREHLEYVWLGSLNMPGPSTWIRKYRLYSWSKPILIFANGTWRPDMQRTYCDTFTSPKAEKALHDWQQQLDPFLKLVETFSEAGQLIVDPFLGSGTTAVACRQLGRRFIGCDIDSQAVATARMRLAGDAS